MGWMARSHMRCQAILHDESISLKCEGDISKARPRSDSLELSLLSRSSRTTVNDIEVSRTPGLSNHRPGLPIRIAAWESARYYHN